MRVTATQRARGSATPQPRRPACRPRRARRRRRRGKGRRTCLSAADPLRAPGPPPALPARPPVQAWSTASDGAAGAVDAAAASFRARPARGRARRRCRARAPARAIAPRRRASDDPTSARRPTRRVGRCVITPHCSCGWTSSRVFFALLSEHLYVTTHLYLRWRPPHDSARPFSLSLSLTHTVSLMCAHDYNVIAYDAPSPVHHGRPRALTALSPSRLVPPPRRRCRCRRSRSSPPRSERPAARSPRATPR